MKMLPVQLSLNPPLGLWSDMLWRCPPAPSSQLAELKTQLPPSLPSDPRLWGREDVAVFLRFCEREFDLPKVDHDLFQMNGKALCLLTRADFGHRCPGAGDVLHNVLQMLIIESHMMQWHLPNSPVTPTSRYPLSPHSHPQTPTWPPIGAPPESPFHNAHMHHFMAPNSVTLSPPPSVDSQASSPPQSQEQNLAAAAAAAAAAVSTSSSSSSSTSSSGSSNNGANSNCSNGSNSKNNNTNLVPPSISVTMSSGNSFAAPHHAAISTSANSNQSDSDEESNYSELAAAKSLAKSGAAAAMVTAHYSTSPPTTPILKDMPQSLSQQITNSFVNSWSQSQAAMDQKYQPNGGSASAPTTPSYMQPVKREFFPETTEPNTNGRLLWDFLQQLLNDRNQKYSDLIAWKCRDTGVFKIVDPAGLAKLWGIQKNHLSMNYDKMSRALRYYYRVNILRKVQGERHCYQFLRNPTELKNIKNISLLRQSVAGNGLPTAAGVNGASGSSNNNSNNTNSNNNNQQSPSTNLSNTNWTLPTHHQQSPQRHQATSHGSSSSSNNINSSNSHHSHQHNHNLQHNNNGGVGNQHMSLPAISQSAAAAAVAAAAAAAYGPPPTSPLFMHAINGAFQYLSNNTGAQPNSPAMPHTPSEKFQFGALKVEHNSRSSPDHGEDLKPTDLSVAGNSCEKRPYSTPSAEDCYPLIRNADGLTTIKLIRYNNESNEMAAAKQAAHENERQQQQLHQQASCATDCNNSAEQQQQQQQHTPMEHMDNDGNDDETGSHMATDLRK
ncbi:ets DNA-binding protein pokkuri [Eurosta solidaginis]|uniref:ets DNA-binding protein pokkuri n=1 Tax=Eurosta solidaginis TaxID=178769 RepID=UPI0035316C11